MPLFSRARVVLRSPSPLIEDVAGPGDAPSSPKDPSLVLARVLREALAALERPRLSSDDIAVHMLRLGHRARDPRDLEL